jgi:hypothetical protein
VTVPLFGVAAVASIVAQASPSPSPAPDACAADGHTSLLAALNRPTIGFSTCAVKRHDVLVELGYANQSGDAPQVTVPQGFLRFGLGENLEADVIGPALQFNRGGRSGWLDSGAGMKWQYVSSSGNSAALDVLYTVPSGSAAFTSGRPVETLNFDYSRSLSNRFAIGTTMGFAQSHLFSLLPSLVITDQYNDRAQVYAEAYGQIATRPGGAALFGLDGGVQYLLCPQLEVDVEAGRTITSLSRNHYYGFGLGVRL